MSLHSKRKPSLRDKHIALEEEEKAKKKATKVVLSTKKNKKHAKSKRK